MSKKKKGTITITKAPKPSTPWPAILNRYMEEATSAVDEYKPRRVRRRFNGQEIVLWQGMVHYEDVHGYAENIRLKYYLKRWRSSRNIKAVPTSEQIYEIMLDADKTESPLPFAVARIADSIARDGIQDPIVVYADDEGTSELWDGNRRFYGTTHIMSARGFENYRESAQWLPALVVTPQGSASADTKIKHNIITELNFVEKDFIRWPAYVRAEQIYTQYTQRMKADPLDQALSKKVKEALAQEYGLKGWRVADRWVKMYELAGQFRDFHEETHERDEADVDLKIQSKFEYFDELSKPGVWGALKEDPDARDEVFNWLWDGKFQAFPDVRYVPKILADSEARERANMDYADAVKDAIKTVHANDPGRAKDKRLANAKIEQFADWLNSFTRDDYKKLSRESLERLREVLVDVTKILSGLLPESDETESETA